MNQNQEFTLNRTEKNSTCEYTSKSDLPSGTRIDMPVVKLRPHHGMCLYFFEGKGYSEGFVANMQRVKNVLATNPKVHLTVRTDSICMACPNNIDGICQSAAQVEKYDRAVLSCCGLEEGQELPFFSFSRLIKEKIFDKGRREEICGRCQWSDICQQ